MKIQTLARRLEKAGSKLQSDNTFVLESKLSGKSCEFKVMKNHDSDNVFGFSYTPKNAEHTEDTIIFDRIQDVTRFMF